MPYHYTTGDRCVFARQTLTSFQFYRFRFHFRARQLLRFPRGVAGNSVRGAFGRALRKTASREAYTRLFEPAGEPGASPSGLTDWPRPFVLRTTHLDGVAIEPEAPFFIDVNCFAIRQPCLADFRPAFVEMARSGLGPTRGSAHLERVEQLDLHDNAYCLENVPCSPSVISLDPEPMPAQQVTVEFVTPTELKTEGGLAERPEFPVLFGRMRDRLATLSSLYGAGPFESDFRAMGERSAAVRLVRSRLKWERVDRRSGRTGQVHSIGGFTGEAEYEGPLAEFLPWLRAGRWTGVGRHTVWGKGEIRV